MATKWTTNFINWITCRKITIFTVIKGLNMRTAFILAATLTVSACATTQQNTQLEDALETTGSIEI
ncbi:hypothetical protein, partial [Staphylococcus pasteuri_A]